MCWFIYLPCKVPWRNLKSEIKRNFSKLKVIEKTGNTLRRNLHKTSITGKTECDDVKCPLCTTSKKKGMCRKEGVTYEIECCKCGDKYIGETGRSARARTLEHMNDLRMKKESSILWRHCREEHNGETERFKCSVRTVYGQDATFKTDSRSCRYKERKSQYQQQNWMEQH